MSDADWIDITEALSDLDFPATKQDIVNHVRRRDAPEPVQRLLRALPLGTYLNISEIRSSAPPRPDVDEGLSASEQAHKARGRHTHHGKLVAEHLRDTG
ncbi:MAG TPA: DUF2795 domain-containing protein [Micromonosporaceae bacterium]|nr:DUF2795 domain-containing protein [Micromonosporaceae bacterium]